MMLKDLIQDLVVFGIQNPKWLDNEVFVQVGNDKSLLTEFDLHTDDSGEEVIKRIVLS